MATDTYRSAPTRSDRSRLHRALWLVAGAGAVLYLLRPGRTVATAVQEVAALGTGTITLSPQQAEMKALIDREFAAAGLGWAAPAAMANAWRESRLDPKASGDNGHSIGLFQLNDCAKCAGAGMSLASRQDPVVNTRRIIEVAKGSAPFMATRGQTHGTVARAFANYVENCALCGPGEADSEATVRYLAQLYGASAPDTVAA